jgi:hypothetical protein
MRDTQQHPQPGWRTALARAALAGLLTFAAVTAAAAAATAYTSPQPGSVGTDYDCPPHITPCVLATPATGHQLVWAQAEWAWALTAAITAALITTPLLALHYHRTTGG